MRKNHKSPVDSSTLKCYDDSYLLKGVFTMKRNGKAYSFYFTYYFCLKK